MSRTVDLAALVLDGPAGHRWVDGLICEDTFGRAVLARGLRMTTDLDRVDLRPVAGWRLSVDATGVLTLDWPHRHRLLDQAPVDLPPGWRQAAENNEFVLVVAGAALGLSDGAGHRDEPVGARLARAALAGRLATGAVTAAGLCAPPPSGSGPDDRAVRSGDGHQGDSCGGFVDGVAAKGKHDGVVGVSGVSMPQGTHTPAPTGKPM